MIEITCARERIDVDLVHRFLSTESYWARGIPRELVQRAIDHSLPFSAFDGDAQIAFARVITDYATYAYLADVFVLPSHRGRGISKALMAAITDHPELQSLRRWSLVTRDAHALYTQFGFTPLDHPERHMMKTIKNPYGPVDDDRVSAQIST
ncbi:MAG TPA: GNAT family N-acetyltransferase [Thermoanaerobaculia bacterium]|jgi:N-acetylglutamate synthase-like GNAT family acetyltransferase